MALVEKTGWEVAKQDISADEDFTNVKDEKLIRVDLACGNNKKEGFVGADLHKTETSDVVHNLLEDFPWPFEDNSVYEFFCSHFVEHIPIQLKDGSYGMNRFMEEVWRCLIPGGIIHIVAPYYTSVRAWQDPTHCRGITELTFSYYNKDVVASMGVGHYMAKCNFASVSKTYALNPEWESKSDEAREFARKHYYNVVADIAFVLRKINL